MPHLSITDLAAALVERTRAQTKVASSAEPPKAPVVLGSHPLTAVLKLAAEGLRSYEAPAATLEDLLKAAGAPGQPVTGAQAPAAGNGTGTAGAPTLPGLTPTNAGVQAGLGGAAPQAKLASSAMGDALRNLAIHLRDQHATEVLAKTASAERALAHLVAIERTSMPSMKIAGFGGIPAPSLSEMGDAVRRGVPTVMDAAQMGIPGAVVGGLKGAIQAPEGEGLEGAARGAAVGGLAGSALGHLGGAVNPDFRIPASALGGVIA